MVGPQPILGGRYRLEEPLGTGGMSVVWRGYDEVLERPVAVKSLDAEKASDAALRQRIRREAQAAARLCHPHLANIFDYGESALPDAAMSGEGDSDHGVSKHGVSDHGVSKHGVSNHGDPVPYVVMELVAGEPMSARLGASGVLPWRTAVTICAEVASALAEAHAHGVVHRDVKPGNILLTPAGAKLVDFGISALVGESDFGLDPHLLGTPAYVAPERLDGWHADTASDVYALGLVLYRALSGGLPWDVDTTPQMLAAHRTEDPAPLPDLPELPAEVASLCRACMAKDPEGRPSSSEVARILGHAVGVVVPLPLGPEHIDGEHIDREYAGREYAGRVHAGRVHPLAAYGSVSPDHTAATSGVATLPDPTLLDAVDAIARTASSPSPWSPSPWRRPDGWRRPRWLASGLGWVPSMVTTRTAVSLLAAGVLLLSVAVTWDLAASDAGDRHGAGIDPATDSVAATLCQVSYEIQREWATGFDASLTVTNTGASTIEGATLRFAFPGDQMIMVDSTAGDPSAASWDQSGREVSTAVGGPGGSLGPGTSARLHLKANYRTENETPTLFYLADIACAAQTVGASSTGEVSDTGTETTGNGRDDKGRGNKGRGHSDDYHDDRSGPGGGGDNDDD